LIEGLSDLATEYLPQVIEIFTEWSAEMQKTIGPALMLINDALQRMAVAMGMDKEALDPLKLGLSALKGILDAVVAGVQLTAVVIQVLAGAFEGIRWQIDRTVEGWNALGDAFARIRSQIDRVVEGWRRIISIFGELQTAIPAWLVPGSPTPMEMGLRGIAEAMTHLPSELTIGTAISGPLSPGGTASASFIGALTLNVIGTSDPHETARLVIRELQDRDLLPRRRV
jgi:hypothetical protein